MLTKEDIILIFLEDPENLAMEIWNENVPKSDEIRTLICELGNPDCAYWYAIYIDKGPTDETRTAGCRDPWRAYCYAMNIDKGPTDETRTAACQDSFRAHIYALNVDKGPTDETRTAAFRNENVKDCYKQWENSLRKI